MFINRIFLCLLLFVSPRLYASATNSTTSSSLNELTESILPNYSRRHTDFISRMPQDNPDERKDLSSRFIELSNVYVLKSKLLWTLSLKKNIYAFEWQNKQIEDCLPDDWDLVRINQGTLTYSSGLPSNASSSTEPLLNFIDLRRMSLTFSLVAYYYNNLALKRSDEENTTPLLAKKDELAQVIQQRALTPFGSWTIASHYAPIPIPFDASAGETPCESSIQGEVERYAKQYESLNVAAETIREFLAEINFEVTNGIIFRATPEYGHHDFSSLELDTLFDQYRDLRQYWNERFEQRQSSARVSPRGEPLLFERKIREIEETQEKIERNYATKALYQSFGFAFMTSDFLEMPGVYEKKLAAFIDPSKALHREATLRTLKRVHTFFTRHQTLFINVFKERFEFFLMQIALLGAKKKTFSLPPYFHLIAKNYFLATPEYFDHAATHLGHIIANLESIPPMVAATTIEQESKHHKKSVFSGITGVFSKLTLLSQPESGEESAPQVTSVTNPLFAKHKKPVQPAKGPTTPLPSSITSSSSPNFSTEAPRKTPSLVNPNGLDSGQRPSSVPELCLKGLLLQNGSKSAEPLLPRGEITKTEDPIGASPRKIPPPSSPAVSPRLAVDFSNDSPRNGADSALSSPTSPRSSAEKSDAPKKKLLRFNSFTRHSSSRSKDSVSSPIAKHSLTPRGTSSRDTIVDSGVKKSDGEHDTTPSTAPETPKPRAH